MYHKRDNMDFLFWCIGIFICCQLFFNWYNDKKIKELQDEIKELQDEIKELQEKNNKTRL